MSRVKEYIKEMLFKDFHMINLKFTAEDIEYIEEVANSWSNDYDKGLEWRLNILI